MRSYLNYVNFKKDMEARAKISGMNEFEKLLERVLCNISMLQREYNQFNEVHCA